MYVLGPRMHNNAVQILQRFTYITVAGAHVCRCIFTWEYRRAAAALAPTRGARLIHKPYAHNARGGAFALGK